VTSGTQSSRFYFSGVRVGNFGRSWSALLVIGSVFLAAFVRSLIWSPIFILFALGGAYGLIRPAEPGWYVEVQAAHLLVNMLSSRKIAYKDIRSADFAVYRHAAPIRAMANLAIVFGRLFGGQSPTIKEYGEIDEGVVELKLVRTLWIYIPFPPFLIPTRSAWLRVDDAAALRSEVGRKLSAMNRPQHSA